MSSASASQLEAGGATKHVWYRSPMYAAVIIGICNFCAPGRVSLHTIPPLIAVWVAMNSIGGGGQATPFLVNAANTLTFSIMVVTAFLGSTVLNLVGVNWALFIGGVGYAPYVAGLYTNNVFGTEWLVLFGATTCGISAGLFWAIEAAVAFAYPEPERLGKFLGIWMSFRVGGQIVGGAINLGMNATRGSAGSINPKVYLVFVALQAAGPFTSFLLPRPDKVQRRDGKAVKIYNGRKVWDEIKGTWGVMVSKEILLLVPFIVQGAFPESWINTYMASHFTVRVRALGSFVAAWACVIIGNVVGKYLDLNSISLKTRARYTFLWFTITRAGWWIWAIVLESNFPSHEAIDWTSPLFGKSFAVYVLLSANFQGLFLYTYFVCKAVSKTHEDEARIAGLLRSVQSAAMAVAYGTSSIKSFALLGSAALNFGLWGIALVPSWLVIRRIGVDLNGPVAEDDESDQGQVAHLPRADNASTASDSEEKK
ncbi:hypothetical protein Q8F55_007304 [Vanrija albida]|uniref:Major facilitator superfamily (MFS) profile domain-containing protein n=1 Tax=Vanrija albida TaxID=181172 RepID=A0ABR3Q0F9_9TREE